MGINPQGIERQKPCGLEVHCPLVDEHRFFAEASTVLWQAGLTPAQASALVPLAIGKWCKALAARQVRPRLPECRQVMAEAAAAWRKEPGHPRQAFAALLGHRARACQPRPLAPAEVTRALACASLAATEAPSDRDG